MDEGRPRYRVGFDIGGTFTDFVRYDKDAARVHIVEKGRDPRRYAIVAMGGAGPAHAARVARKLDVGEVLVPPASGAASALGFLVAPVSFEAIKSLRGLVDELDPVAVNGLLAQLEAEGRRKLQATAFHRACFTRAA